MEIKKKLKLPKNAKRIFNVFNEYGFESRIVGGAVRDFVMNEEPRDLDFAVNISPVELMYILQEEFNDKEALTIRGIRHGTVVIMFSAEEMYEITALDFRITKIGNKIIMMQTPDWEADAKARDFTVNSLSMKLDGTIYDYVGGIKDIKNQVVKFNGDYNKILQEEPLLIFRFFKLIAKFKDPKFDKNILEVIRQNLTGITKIKRETAQWFILNIKQQKNGEAAIKMMEDIGFNVTDYVEQHSLSLMLKKMYLN